MPSRQVPEQKKGKQLNKDILPDPKLKITYKYGNRVQVFEVPLESIKILDKETLWQLFIDATISLKINSLCFK